jgi:hypothetical protein
LAKPESGLLLFFLVEIHWDWYLSSGDIQRQSTAIVTFLSHNGAFSQFFRRPSRYATRDA